MKISELLSIPSTYEIAVLSCCLNAEEGKINSAMGDAIAAGVRREMFTDNRDQRLWEILTYLYAKDPCACNFLHVYDYCTTTGAAESVGGMDHVKEILDKCDITINFPHFLNDFLRHYVRKATYIACQNYQNKLLSDFTSDLYDLNDSFAASILAMSRNDRKKTVYRPEEFVDLMVEQIQAEASCDAREAGLETGFQEIDRLFPMGLANGSLVVIGAAPSVGKTVLGMNLLTHACAVRGDKNVRGAFFSAEMLPRELASREWKAVLTEPSAIRKPKTLVEQYCSALRAKFRDSKLYAINATGMTISPILSTARRLHSSEPLKVLCFDYLQKIPMEEKVINREREVASWVSAFKQLATELECVVILLSQLNRSARNEFRYPIMSDLRDSGQIEQDADIIILIDEKRDGEGHVLDTSQDRVKERWFHVAKNRNGARGNPILGLMAECFKFVPLLRTEDDSR